LREPEKRQTITGYLYMLLFADKALQEKQLQVPAVGNNPRTRDRFAGAKKGKCLKFKR
jgi:hypothetical protein